MVFPGAPFPMGLSAQNRVRRSAKDESYWRRDSGGYNMSTGGHGEF